MSLSQTSSITSNHTEKKHTITNHRNPPKTKRLKNMILGKIERSFFFHFLGVIGHQKYNESHIIKKETQIATLDRFSRVFFEPRSVLDRVSTLEPFIIKQAEKKHQRPYLPSESRDRNCNTCSKPLVKNAETCVFSCESNSQS